MTAQIETVFLADVLAHLEDDVARLVYADWLEENGAEKRAELIRVQCLLAQQPECLNGRGAAGLVWCCRVCDLRRRERQLLRATGTADSPIYPQARAEWVPSLRDALPWDMGGWTWHRGFVTEIACTCQEWLRHGPQWVREYPLTEVKLLDKEPSQAVESDFVKGPRWHWWQEGERRRYPNVAAMRTALWTTPAWLLPASLRQAMPIAERQLGWDTAEAAQKALSDACLKWAKEERTAHERG